MSRNDVEVVQAALHDAGWSQVARALGVPYRGPRHRECCPMHGGKDENLTLDVHNGRLAWFCASHCGSGDVISMIRQLRGCSFAEALREAADIVGVELDTPDDPEARAQRERERAAYIEAHRERVAVESEPEPEYPPGAEVAALWDGAGAVDQDPAVADYLASRAIDPAGAASRGLLRAVRPGQPLPRWARYRGSQAAARTWAESTHRILVRVWDHLGECRSVRAWRIGDDPTPKRLPPAGYRASGLVLANGTAVELLRGNWGPCRLLVVEGEPDWAVHAVRSSEPVIGILSGSWSAEFAERVPFGSEVVIRTHTDDAGDKYAAKVLGTLRGRCTVRRLQREEMAA